MARVGGSFMIEGLDYVPTTELTQYANATHKWLFDDSKERYKSNCTNPEIAKHISTQELTYRLNTHGFRSREIVEDKNCIVALGCSHTFGLGLGEQDTYIAKLASMLDISYYNLGVPGGASDTAFRIASYWLPIIKPKYVVMVTPEITRFEIIRTNGDAILFNASTTQHDKLIEDIAKHFLVNDANPIINRQKNLLAIENIVKTYDGKFYWYTEDIMAKTIENDLARDWQHSGPKQNYKVAQQMYSDIKW